MLHVWMNRFWQIPFHWTVVTENRIKKTLHTPIHRYNHSLRPANTACGHRTFLQIVGPLVASLCLADANTASRLIKSHLCLPKQNQHVFVSLRFILRSVPCRAILYHAVLCRWHQRFCRKAGTSTFSYHLKRASRPARSISFSRQHPKITSNKFD